MTLISDALIAFSLAGLAVFSAVLALITTYVAEIMAKVSEIPALLAPIKTQLEALGTDLADGAVQLDKAKNEILNAIDGELSPGVTSAIDALASLASSLATKGAAVKVVAQALDDLNVDAPPVEPPVEPPVVAPDPDEETEEVPV